MARLSSICLSVRTSRMYCGSWVALRGKLFTRIILAFLSRLSTYKIWGMQFNEIIFKFMAEWRGRENVRFSTDNWPCLGNSEIYGQGYY